MTWMTVTTTENIPGKTYTIVGFVESTKGISGLQDQADMLGANAIVCVRFVGTTLNYAYGTAVKLN